jgi:hypothetical protein
VTDVLGGTSRQAKHHRNRVDLRLAASMAKGAERRS